MKFKDIEQLTRASGYRVNMGWRYIQEWMDQGREIKLDIDPDFQRVHVWDEEKKVKYVEFILKGGQSGRELYFNCAGWTNDYRGPFVLVDGKQRLDAVTRFMNDDLRVFGKNLYSDFEDRISVIGPDFLVNVNNLETRAEVLKWYLEMNSGGVAHTSEEIQKVRDMLEAEPNG